MASELEEILSEVLKKTTPGKKDKEHILDLAERLKNQVDEAVKKAGLEAEVRLEGSVAKNTWLRESPEIDIFIQVPPTIPREDFSTVFLDIAKEATRGAKHVERFAEHPYLEAVLDGAYINIVPCYRVKKGEWKSSTDRTPFHTDYVKPLLDDRLSGEIRLLKRFMKGIDVYGAEIKVGGFSGYLCELLILHYGSFLKTLKAAANWMTRTFIDLKGYYKGQEGELGHLFEEPLVIVDPVDKRRNAASAVRQERLDEFVAASRVLLEEPSEEVFYPQETKPFGRAELLQAVKKRGTSMVFIHFGKMEVVSDILWGQLYKSLKALRKLVEQHDFTTIREAVWSDEQNLNVFLLEVKHRHLPPLKKHIGPPLEKRSGCDSFLRKHIEGTLTLSGPRIEKGRWVVEVRRQYVDILELLEEKLKHGGKFLGMQGLISKAGGRALKIQVNEEILPIYLRNSRFAKFLTEYLLGRPKWLHTFENREGSRQSARRSACDF